MARNSRQEASEDDGPGTGFADGLSQSQVRALKELRATLGERIQHPRFTDVLLLRFLRAKQFDVAAASGQLEKHLAFRAERGLDGSSPSFSLGPATAAFPEIPAMKRYYPHGFHKTDRLGRPIYIERLGKLDVSGLLVEVQPERLLQYFAYEAERQTTFRLPACSLACGRLVESTVTILDLDGLGFRTASNTSALKIVRSIMREQEENFPEITGNMLIVNAPAAFSIAWSVLKPLLSASTAEKIEVFRSGQADYRKRLVELVAPENLPDFLGGTCVCAHCSGGCLSSDAGPWQEQTIVETLARTPFWEVLRRPMPGNLHTEEAEEEAEGEVVPIRRLSVVHEDAEEDGCPTAPDLQNRELAVDGGSGGPCGPQDAEEDSSRVPPDLQGAASNVEECSGGPSGPQDAEEDSSPIPPDLQDTTRSVEECSGGHSGPQDAEEDSSPIPPDLQGTTRTVEECPGGPSGPQDAASSCLAPVEEGPASQSNPQDASGLAEEDAIEPWAPQNAVPSRPNPDEQSSAVARGPENGSGGAEESSALSAASNSPELAEQGSATPCGVENASGLVEESSGSPSAPQDASPSHSRVAEESPVGPSDQAPERGSVSSSDQASKLQVPAAEEGSVGPSDQAACSSQAASSSHATCSSEKSPLRRVTFAQVPDQTFPSPRALPEEASSNYAEDPVPTQWALSATCLRGREHMGIGLETDDSESQCQVEQEQGSSAGLGVEPQVLKAEPEERGPWYRYAHEKDMVQWLRESAQALGPYVSCGSRYSKG